MAHHLSAGMSMSRPASQAVLQFSSVSVVQTIGSGHSIGIGRAPAAHDVRDLILVTESPPRTHAHPTTNPPARTSNSARTALLKVRISRRWYDSRPSSLRCCRSSTSARRRWPKASARQIPSELDDQHPPSREDRPSDVLADLWYQKAPIDARDDVQSTVVRLDVAPCHCLSCSARALVPHVLWFPRRK